MAMEQQAFHAPSQPYCADSPKDGAQGWGFLSDVYAVVSQVISAPLQHLQASRMMTAPNVKMAKWRLPDEAAMFRCLISYPLASAD
jgi:hypothetical protein